MKDLEWYAIQRDVLKKAMKGIIIDEVGPDFVTYHKPRTNPVTIDRPPQEDLYVHHYGSMLMDGYTIVPSPDGAVHLCGGGTAVYSVTPSSCTCPASTYSRDGVMCKHMNMLKGYEIHRLRAMVLRSSALEPTT